jgi:hypothetical protein
MRLSSACTAVALLTLLFTPVWLSADITCEQSVTIVRGAGNRVLRGMQGVGVGTPVTTKVFIHGDRMIRSSGQRDVLFDLEHGTVTQIRRDKKTYSVLTFEQYGTAMHLPAPGARKPGETPAGEARLVFSGGCAIRLELECLEARMADLGPRWRVRHAPGHAGGALSGA